MGVLAAVTLLASTQGELFLEQRIEIVEMMKRLGAITPEVADAELADLRLQLREAELAVIRRQREEWDDYHTLPWWDRLLKTRPMKPWDMTSPEL